MLTGLLAKALLELAETLGIQKLECHEISVLQTLLSLIQVFPVY